MAVVRQRAGRAYDPRVAECFLREAPRLLAILDAGSAWDVAMAAEPGDHIALSDGQLDGAARAIADFADLLSPSTVGHSSGVADLAALAAEQSGRSAADVRAVRRAGLPHDVGRTGVSVGIWDKAGALTEGEWERIRLHAYSTKRVLARPRGLRAVGALAAQHHERLDGSGYHKGLPAAALPPAARLLAAADAYHAMREPRPYRPPHAPAGAADALRAEVRAGRLDGEAARAVLTAAGHRGPAARRERPAGLSEREVEVLRLAARGHANRRVAKLLCVAPATVDHHLHHIYGKIGVATRAAATLFAMQHDLLGAHDGPGK